MPTTPAANTAGLAVVALLFNALVWGVSWWPFRALQGHGLHPLWTTAIAHAVATLGLTVFKPQAWRAWVQHPAIAWLAIGSGLTNICFNWAVTVGDVVRVVLLFYLMPAWSVLLAWPLLGGAATARGFATLSVGIGWGDTGA